MLSEKTQGKGIYSLALAACAPGSQPHGLPVGFARQGQDRAPQVAQLATFQRLQQNPRLGGCTAACRSPQQVREQRKSQPYKASGSPCCQTCPQLGIASAAGQGQPGKAAPPPHSGLCAPQRASCSLPAAPLVWKQCGGQASSCPSRCALASIT